MRLLLDTDALLWCWAEYDFSTIAILSIACSFHRRFLNV
jgi:hypothetical protein